MRCLVVFTDDEPISGWATSLKSVSGLCLGVGLGAIRVLLADPDVCATVVPADKVANMIITSAWHASKTRYCTQYYRIRKMYLIAVITLLLHYLCFF